MFAAEPDMNRLFQLPPNTYVGGNEACLPFPEIIRRFEVPKCYPFLCLRNPCAAETIMFSL